MGVLGKYFKVPLDNKRYAVDYSDWLDSGEQITSITYSVLPIDASPVVITGNVLNTPVTGGVFYAGGGLANTTYTVYLTMTSNSTPPQVKEDTIQIVVRSP